MKCNVIIFSSSITGKFFSRISRLVRLAMLSLFYENYKVFSSKKNYVYENRDENRGQFLSMKSKKVS